MLPINVAFLLSVIIYIRLPRRTQARSRNDELLTVIIVMTFGVLIAPTAFNAVLARNSMAARATPLDPVSPRHLLVRWRLSL